MKYPIPSASRKAIHPQKKKRLIFSRLLIPAIIHTSRVRLYIFICLWFSITYICTSSSYGPVTACVLSFQVICPITLLGRESQNLEGARKKRGYSEGISTRSELVLVVVLVWTISWKIQKYGASNPGRFIAVFLRAIIFYTVCAVNCAPFAKCCLGAKKLPAESRLLLPNKKILKWLN